MPNFGQLAELNRRPSDPERAEAESWERAILRWSPQKFRSDLYYRLDVFLVRVRRCARGHSTAGPEFCPAVWEQLGKTIDVIPAETMSALARHPWPGNVREIQNVIERAVMLAIGPVLTVRVDDLRVPNHVHASPSAAAIDGLAASPAGSMRDALAESERQQILAALEESHRVLAPDGAAARLGLKRSTLRSDMQKVGTSSAPRSGPVQQVPKQGSPMPFFR